MTTSLSRALPRNVLIRASAGTGKTFQLSVRYLSLLNEGVSTDTILATTFTRKAAGEILERVFLLLASAIDDPNQLGVLREQLDDDALDVERCRQLLLDLCRSMHRVRICTLDSFFLQLAQGFSLELQLLPGWTIGDESVSTELVEHAIDSLLGKHDAGDTLRLMNLLSGGDVKRSVSDQIRDTVREIHDLYLMTDEAAWHRMQRRTQLTADELDAVLGGLSEFTESPKKSLAKACAEDIQRARARDWQQLLSKGIAGKLDAGETKYRQAEIPDAVRDAYTPLIDHARAELFNQIVNQTEATYALVDRFDAVYRQLMVEQGILRFNDVTRLLAKSDFAPSETAFDFRLDGRLQHLLLDEFQDTSLFQWRVIQPFANRINRASNGSFFCVGDGKQAIYGWRGGVAEIFDAVEQELDGIEPRPLDESRRSAAAVIEIVNRIFNNLTRHPGLTKYRRVLEQWCDAFPEHSTIHTDRPGYACLMTSRRAEEDEKESDPLWTRAADLVETLHKRHPTSSIGVLSRTNEPIGRIVFELRNRGIDVSEEGERTLTDSAAVDVILSLIRIADHPGDTVARFHVSRSSIAEELEYTSHDNDSLATAFSNRLRSELMDDGYGRTIDRWAGLLAPSCSQRDLRRLDKLTNIAWRFDARPAPRPRAFIEFVNVTKVDDASSAPVRVMTVHKSKGLQFDIVVVPQPRSDLVKFPPKCASAADGPTDFPNRVAMMRSESLRHLLPPSLAEAADQTIDRATREALCVLYVALTRAVHALYLIIPPAPPTEKTFPNNVVGLLRASLAGTAAVEPESVVFETGDPRWGSRETPDDTTASAPAQAWLPVFSVRQTRGLERVAPSGREGGSVVNASTLLRRRNTLALERGTVIHAWFERVGWIEDGLLTDDQFRNLIQNPVSDDFDIDGALVDFHRMIEGPDIRLALTRDAYRQADSDAWPGALVPGVDPASLELMVRAERRFSVRKENGIVAGTIDRLVVIHDATGPIAADVVDFKTDAVSSADAAELDARREHYRPQLDLYREAVSQMYGLPEEHVRTRLLMLEAGIVVDL